MSQDAAPGYVSATSELRTAAEHVLSQHFGVQRQIVNLERRPSPKRSSYAIKELDVHLEDGTILPLLFKDASRQALFEVARRAKPAFLHDPLREIETYRAILNPSGLSTATCYGAIVEPHIDRYWLFLERVSGLELYYVGLPEWQRTAAWIAMMHARFAGQMVKLQQATNLLRYDGDFYRLWLRRAQAFALASASPDAGSARKSFARVTARYDQIIERLLALPPTFIHGECYASNVLVQERGGELRVCPVDWEMAALGPGMIDLAALTAGGWTDEQRTAIALAYYTELAGIGDPPLEWAAFLEALDCCRLHLAIQWLGWSDSWTPPPEHAQNWLSDVMDLVDKLGL